MTILQSIWLGIIQGLTEFLPVSSSGHLVIFQHILGMKEAPLTFDILLHWGTLIAVFIAFWDDIVAIVKRPFCKLTYLIILGCIPAGLAGVFLQSYFEKAFESLLVVGLGLIFTGFILKRSEKISRKNLGFVDESEASYMDVLIVGLMQAIAIIPGISRSGSTIAGGLIAGFSRDFAARFSFLLSIPVILGAGLIQLKDAAITSLIGSNILPYIIGPLTAAVFGLLAIKVVMKLVRQGRLSVFSYYCYALGILTISAHFFM
ncbi:MAG TPA: undecaprenyl-diphosphatase [Syntrophomonas sp.]|nr:undecaprenyl-diphosphatase [Syntrophomonas sp.]HCF72069.1 undecaprenyl-diphosphatase [Syntrophomonas sp.]